MSTGGYGGRFGALGRKSSQLPLGTAEATKRCSKRPGYIEEQQHAQLASRSQARVVANIRAFLTGPVHVHAAAAAGGKL